MAKATMVAPTLSVLNFFLPAASASKVLHTRVIGKVRRLGDENGQFRHNRASNV